MTIPYRPVRGLGASLLGDAQLEDQDLQDATLTQPGVVTRGAGASELAARVHQAGGGEIALDPTKGQALFFRPDVADDELCLVHDDTLYSSKPTEVTVNGTQAWRRVGTWAPWTLRQIVLNQPLWQIRDADVATIRDSITGALYQVLVWEQGNVAGSFGQAAAPGIYAMAVDESGATVAPATLLASGANNVNPRACACDTGVVIAWCDTTAFQYRSSAWRFNNPVEFAASALIVGLGAASFTPTFDMRKDGVSDRVMFVHADVDGTPEIRGRTVTVAQVATFVGSFVPIVVATQGIAVDVDPLGGYLVTWASATAAACAHVTSGFVVDTVQASVATANPIVRITGCHVDSVASQGTVAVEQRIGATTDYRDHTQVFAYNGAALAALRTQRGASIWSHAAVFRGRACMWAKHVAGALSPPLPFPAAGYLEFGTWLFTDLRTGDVLARSFPNRGGDDRATDPATFATQPCTPHLIEDDFWSSMVLLDRLAQNATDQIAVTRVAAANEPRKPACVPGYAIGANSGFPILYEGGEAAEADWHVKPTILSLAGVAAGAGKTPGATYLIALTFLWIDRVGNFWRSAPTVRPITLAAGQNRIDISVQPCRWTARRTVMVEVWSSLANAGFPMYLESRFVSNSAVDSTATSAGTADATLSANTQLDQFAPTGILAHETTQVTDFMAVAMGRFWSPDPQRPDILRHTIEHDIGRDGFGWGWEDTQLLQLDTSVRPQAMGELDGSLAVIAGNECHLVYGLGPDKQGSGLFGQPSKFGVVDLETSQAKVARVPDSAVPGGLAYATPRGLYLLRRDRVSQQLSAQVERLFRFDGVEPQAVAYAPEFGEIWLMTLTAEARSMRLSLTTGRWCADSARRAQDIAVSPRGVVAWLLPDSRVRILDETAIADGASNLLFKGETPTIRPDPSTVSTSYTLQQILLHTYLLAGPALLDVSIVDARTGQVITLLQQTYTALGPESRSVGPINLATYGHRVRYSQPAGDTGKIVIVQIDSQMQVSDNVISRTVTTL